MNLDQARIAFEAHPSALSANAWMAIAQEQADKGAISASEVEYIAERTAKLRAMAE